MKQTENVFAQEIRIFRNNEEHSASSQAMREANRLMTAVISRDYLDVSAEQLTAFVRSAFRAMDERGFVNIFPGEQLPNDAFSEFVRKPSYAVTALCVYLKVTLGEAETGWMDEDLKRLMDASFRCGISGHGEERSVMFENVMTALCRAGLDKYLSRGAVLSEAFHRTAESCLEHLLKYHAAPEAYHFTREYYYHIPNLSMAYAACRDCRNPVFVYGTLMGGQSAEGLLGTNAFFGGCAVLQDYALYDLGSFPGIVPCEGEQVIGEVYYVDDETMERLDRYEGEGSLYLRQSVIVRTETWWKLPAKAYIYAHPVSGEPVRERWGMQDDDEVWYAAYGSNLSQERFRCYLEGGTCPQNGKPYPGCRDKRLWTDSEVNMIQGRMYFAKHSQSWNGGGVAFFDRNGCGGTIVRYYRITWGQLRDIQQQEGPSWYGRRLFLGFRDDAAVYTLTSTELLKQTKPDGAYLELIRKALLDCGKTESAADKYLKTCQKRFPRSK